MFGAVQWRRRLWCIGGALLTFHVQGKLSASLLLPFIVRVLCIAVFNKHGKMSVDERSLENTCRREEHVQIYQKNKA